MGARIAVTCLAGLLLAGVGSASSSVGAGASATYRDRVDDAGGAPDIEAVTVTQVDAATLAVTVAFAEPTDLGRNDWLLMGIDADRNQWSGGMHGSEAIVFVNGERAVLFRLGGRFAPVQTRRSATELSFTLRFADIGVHAFDFAVATLRHRADVAPDQGVFRYPVGPSQHAPAPGRSPPGKAR